ncbi:hypothetical protein F4680DRAFT_442869 [Xylaria scruposa]|nr:hypothetical protein F4680DRAFT_442869 [Xylaria scruposa]
MEHYYYNPGGVPWVPTNDEVLFDRLRKSRDEMQEMLEGDLRGDEGLTRHYNTVNRFIEWYERRHGKSEKLGASGNLPTTDEPSVQAADKPSIPQHQPDRIEDSSRPSSSTQALITASSSPAIVWPSAQKCVEGQFAAYLWACNISLFPYPLNKCSRFFPSDDHHDDQHVATTAEEQPSDFGTQGCWARAIGQGTSSDSVGDENHDTTS